jgi:hypothetical protein
MLALINILILSSLDPVKNIVSLKTYISENAKVYCPVYFIYQDIDEKLAAKVIEKDKETFLAQLKSLGVECKEIGGYYFFIKK